MNQRGVRTWQCRTLHAGDWGRGRAAALPLRLLARPEGLGTVIKAARTGELAGVGRLGVAGKTLCAALDGTPGCSSAATRPLAPAAHDAHPDAGVRQRLRAARLRPHSVHRRGRADVAGHGRRLSLPVSQRSVGRCSTRGFGVSFDHVSMRRRRCLSTTCSVRSPAS